MVKKRTYRKRSYRRRFKRRTYKKRYRRSGSKYDGLIRAKIRMTGYVNHSSASGHADFTVQWGSNSGPLASSYSRVMDSAEFDHYWDNFL